MRRVTSQPTRPIAKQVRRASIGCYSIYNVWRAARAWPRKLDKALLCDRTLSCNLQNDALNTCMIVNEVIRLGQTNSGPADQFVQDFIDMSDEHPFNPRARIVGGAALELSRFGNRIHLSDITSLEPGKGHAGRAMSLIKKLADKHNVQVELIAKAYRDDRMDTEQLIQWYQRLGFQLMDNPDEIGLDDGIEMRYYP